MKPASSNTSLVARSLGIDPPLMMQLIKPRTAHTAQVLAAGLSRVQGVEAGLSTLNRLVRPTRAECFSSDDSSI